MERYKKKSKVCLGEVSQGEMISRNNVEKSSPDLEKYKYTDMVKHFQNDQKYKLKTNSFLSSPK